ncbi:MAG: GTP 3',8-cyclase MoaA [Eubacteriales bacterium]|nr:GTP 3',8-cyclase MoaA [Eubacteriales bacterium]
MYDHFQRKIDYMRISITDRCNLRCRYCMPDDINLLPMDEILRYEEILDVCRQVVELGIVKFKITGGEPLVRRGCTDLIRQIKQLPGVEQVTLTTNGIRLKECLPQLKEAKLDGINISLDTLKRERFQAITRFDQLDQVLDGIYAAVEEGFRVKINCVLQKGSNDDEWLDLLALAKDMPLDVRFIELMPIGDGKTQEMVSNITLIEALQEIYPDMVRDECIHGNGPAIYYQIPGFLGSVGFISAIHGKFCSSCNRIRMTATGDIKPCLCFDTKVSVKDAVRKGDLSLVKNLLEKAILDKPKMHCFEEIAEITEIKRMVQIGG